MKVRDVAGEHIVMRMGAAAGDMTTVMALNETSMLIYNSLKERPFDLDDVVALLTDTFEVEADQARTDAAEWEQKMREYSLIVDA